MSGDLYKRREVSPDVYQCGCRWDRMAGWGDVLVECPIHRAATAASVSEFERERMERADLEASPKMGSDPTGESVTR